MSTNATPHSRRGHRVGALLTALLTALLVTGGLAACGEDGGSSAQGTSAPPVQSTSASPAPSAPSEQDAYCQAADNLRASVDALTTLDLQTAGVPGIRAAVTKVETDLAAARAAASATSASELDVLQAAVTTLRSAADQLGSEVTAQNLAALASAVTAVGTAAKAYKASLTSCG